MANINRTLLEPLAGLSAVDMAVELRRRHICNCCQAVVLALADDPKLLNAAAGFGGGMGCGLGPCGALIGAVIAAGEITDGSGTTRLSRQIFEKFRERSGAIVCRELKGAGTGQILCSCDDCVRNAVNAFQEVTGK